jgi:hypothetical protein
LIGSLLDNWPQPHIFMIAPLIRTKPTKHLLRLYLH